MGKSVLIPFALQDGRLVDISQVESGKACNCTCPSCGQALVARKGKSDRVHHFAHNKNMDENIEEKIKCEYSFYVAARLVIKQIFSEKQKDEWLLPCLELTYEPKQPEYNHLKTSMVITKEQMCTLGNYQTERSVDKVSMDIVAEVKGVQIAIFFTYPSRPYPEIKKHKKYGVLGIDLEGLTKCYSSFDFNAGKFFQDEIIRYVLNEGKRKWLYHPREQWTENWANDELEERVLKFKEFEQTKADEVPVGVVEPQQVIPSESSVFDPFLRYRKRNGNRYCPRCDYFWHVSYGGTNSCPKCYLGGKEAWELK